MHHLAQSSRSSSQVFQYTILRINLPEHGTCNVTCIFRTVSTSQQRRHQERAILTNYSDIPSTTEAATQLQNMQTSPTEPLVTFNHRYKAIHKVAFELSPNQQYNRTVIVEYAKKLPQNTRDKLLRKIAKKNSYIQMLDN